MSHVPNFSTPGASSRRWIRAALSAFVLVGCSTATPGATATAPRPLMSVVPSAPVPSDGPAGNSPGTAAATASAPTDPPPVPSGDSELSVPSTAASTDATHGSVPSPSVTANAPGTRPLPTRIVSLSPTATETLFALGAAATVVAVDQASSYPPIAPRTSLSALTPDVNAVLALKPDLVVTELPDAALTAALHDRGIEQVVGPPAKTLQDSYDQIRMLGTKTGHSATADQIVASMQARVAAIVAKAPVRSAALRYYHERDDRYSTVTSTSFLGQLYGLLHLQSIADGADSTSPGHPQLSALAVAAADPDLVFLADAKCCRQTVDSLRTRPGWSDMKAVSGKGVVTLDDDLASRWGPRIVDLLQAVSNRLSALSVN